MKVRKLHTKKKQIDNERYKFKIVNSRQFEFQYFTEKKQENDRNLSKSRQKKPLIKKG